MSQQAIPDLGFIPGIGFEPEGIGKSLSHLINHKWHLKHFSSVSAVPCYDHFNFNIYPCMFKRYWDWYCCYIGFSQICVYCRCGTRGLCCDVLLEEWFLAWFSTFLPYYTCHRPQLGSNSQQNSRSSWLFLEGVLFQSIPFIFHIILSLLIWTPPLCLVFLT